MSDQWPLYTVLIMLGFFAVVVGVDVVLAVNNRKGDTYSEVIRQAGRKWTPVIVMMGFGMGLLAGHWFWAGPCP
jgi:hypothetical protein